MKGESGVKKYSDKFKARFKNVFTLALLVSLLLHVGVLLKTVDFSDFKTSVASKKKEEKRIKVVVRKKKSEDKKQIVQSQKDKKDAERPKESRFLSHSNNKVDREVVSKKVGKFKEAGKGSKASASTPSSEQQKQPQMRPHKKALSKNARKKSTTPKKLSWEALAKASQKVAKNNLKRAKRSINSKKGLKHGKRGKTGLGRTNDHIEDIPLGDMTKLNTVEYKYYGFYNRIREKLEQYWGKTLKEKAKALYQSKGRVPASENKITSLVVTINNKGEIVDIAIKSTSGVRAFDEAAIESFSKAGPFPNPPNGMVKNGHAEIEWGFVVKG